MEAVYRDDFNISLSNIEVFFNERSENSNWEVARNKDLRFVALDKEDISEIKAVKEYLSEGQSNQEKILADTINNTQLLLKTKDKVYPVLSKLFWTGQRSVEKRCQSWTNPFLHGF